MCRSDFLPLSGERGMLRFAASPFPMSNTYRPRSILRPFVSRLILSLLAVAMGHGLSAITNASDALEPIPEADKPKLLERIRLELTEYQSSIDSIDVKWRRRSLADPDQVPKVMPFGQHQWLRSGRRQLRISEAMMSFDGPVQSRSSVSFDGERGSHLAYHHSDPSKLNSVSILDGEDHNFDAIDVPFLLGWTICGLPTHESLASTMAKGEAKLAGKRLVQGESCYEVEVGRFPWPQLPEPYLILAWIDPQHGWLPRRIRICPEQAYRDSPADAETGVARLDFFDGRVNSFEEVNDALHQKTVFFPKEGEIARRCAISIDEVKLNPPLPLSIFRPEIPDGVQVVTRGAAGFEKTVTGGEAAKAEHERLLDADRMMLGLQEPRPALLPSPTATDARPKSNSSMPGIMLTTSVVAFVAACGFAVRGRFRRQS